MTEKSSKSSHQPSGVGENDVRKIESSVKTNDRVLPEEFRCRANSKGIVPTWVAGCVTHVLHRSEKHHDVRARSRMRKIRDVLTQDGGTVDPGNERGETATLDPGPREPPWVARTRMTSALLRSARRVSIGSQAYFRVPHVCPGTEESWR